ncbi:MAG TPA: oligopeptide:H+ symporter [Planctomycetota bacterium]|nr:oligopeptide:H+ symporter [Planctomycetota bacterium]
MANGDATTQTPGGPEDRGFFGHPKGLSVLFFSELWERFSFYGMRALLVLYMYEELRYSKEPTAYGIYAAYGALVYAFPILGGWLANKWLGYRRSILLGGSLMALGHFAMAIPALERFGWRSDTAHAWYEYSFYGALALLCLGNGFFKPNISSTVGRLYGEHDRRRDRGFTIFYMGINIGAFLSPLVCGYFGENVDWHLGFSIAGVGMVIGLVWFVYGQRWIGVHGEPDDPELLKRPVVAGLNRWHLTILGSFLIVPLIATVLRSYDSAHWIIQGVSAVVLLILIVFTFRLEGVARLRMLALMILMVFHMLFWGGFEQAGSSFNVLTYEHVSRNVGGVEIAASQFQSLNALLIVLLAPLFSILWKKLGDFNREPSVPFKFALGLAQLGLGFLVLVWGIRHAGSGSMVALSFLFFTYFFHTTGELCLSPVGLSAVTKLAPKQWVGFCMGAWFLTIANGHLLAGAIAGLTAGGQASSTQAEAPAEVKKAIVAEIKKAESGVDIAALGQSHALSVEAITSWTDVQSAIASRLAPKEALAVARKYGFEVDEILEWEEVQGEIRDQVAADPIASKDIQAARQRVASRLKIKRAAIESWIGATSPAAGEPGADEADAAVSDALPAPEKLADLSPQELEAARESMRNLPAARRAIAQKLAPTSVPELARAFNVPAETIVSWEPTRREVLAQLQGLPSKELVSGEAQRYVATRLGIDAQQIDTWRAESLEKYEQAFMSVFWIAMAAAVLLAILTPFIKKLMQGVE